MQNKMNRMNAQWVEAFKEIKTVLYKSIENVKNNINTAQKDRKFLPSGSGFMHNTDKVEQQVKKKLQTTPLNRFVNMEDTVRYLKKDISFQHHFSNEVDVKKAIDNQLNHKLFEINAEIKELKTKYSKVISFHQLRFKVLKEADSRVKEHCPRV